MNVYKTIAEELNGQPCLALYRGWSGTEGKIEDMRTGLFSLKETPERRPGSRGRPCSSERRCARGTKRNGGWPSRFS